MTLPAFPLIVGSLDTTVGTIEAWNLIMKCTDHSKHQIWIYSYYQIPIGRQIFAVACLETGDWGGDGGGQSVAVLEFYFWWGRPCASEKVLRH